MAERNENPLDLTDEQIGWVAGESGLTVRQVLRVLFAVHHAEERAVAEAADHPIGELMPDTLSLSAFEQLVRNNPFMRRLAGT